ncbi:MAG: hypothetical protein AAF383_15280 [Cyanobacteria bacterium P01_A01_bin.83]
MLNELPGGVESLYRQLSDNGSVDNGTFLRDVNVGIVTGATASFFTPF